MERQTFLWTEKFLVAMLTADCDTLKALKANEKNPPDRAFVNHSYSIKLPLTTDLFYELRFDYGANPIFQRKKKQNNLGLSGVMRKDEAKGDTWKRLQHFTVFFKIPLFGNKRGGNRYVYKSGPFLLENNFWGFPNFMSFDKLNKYATTDTNVMDLQLCFELVFERHKRQLEYVPDDRPLSYPLAKRRRLNLVTYEMLKDGKFKDFTIRFKKSSDTIECHKCMLASNSPVFKKMFENDPQIHDLEILDEDISYEAMDMLVKFMYTYEIRRVPNTDTENESKIIDDLDDGVEMEEKTDSSELTQSTSTRNIRDMIHDVEMEQKLNSMKVLTTGWDANEMEDLEKLFIAGAKYGVSDVCIDCIGMIVSRMEYNPLLILPYVRLSALRPEFTWIKKHDQKVGNILKMHYGTLEYLKEFREEVERNFNLTAMIASL